MGDPATKIGVGLLTFDQFRTGRVEDFDRTYESLAKAEPDELVVLTNGSTDETPAKVWELGGIVETENSEIWYGNTALIYELRYRDCDLIVLSADDLVYRDGWLDAVRAFEEARPDHLALFSCYLEPVWAWNPPRRVVNYGGQRALIRDSVCGSSWVFRTTDWFDFIGPFPEQMPGEDLVVMQRLAQAGKKVAALDLVDHIGEDHSAWGNQSHLSATPIDREVWGFEPAQ